MAFMSRFSASSSRSPNRKDCDHSSSVLTVFELERLLYTGKTACNHADEVWPNLYLGDQDIAADRRELAKLRITHILNCAHSKWRGGAEYYEGMNITYHGIEAHDSPTFDMSVNFYPASEFIHKALSSRVTSFNLLSITCLQPSTLFKSSYSTACSKSRFAPYNDLPMEISRLSATFHAYSITWLHTSRRINSARSVHSPMNYQAPYLSFQGPRQREVLANWGSNERPFTEVSDSGYLSLSISFRVLVFRDSLPLWGGSSSHNPRRILVHCAVGVSRSAALVLAYLMIRHNMTLVEAIKTVKEQRGIIPNRGFLRQLSGLDEVLRASRRT
ncbi:DUS26 phosphatase, partial [Polyodon spathula]|nr:DUS26 phosphatase [Polyodon spathula]